MPKDLTDSSIWEATRVPVDTDPANAASVELPFQRLTNRTRYLCDRIHSLRISNWFEADVSGVITRSTVQNIACKYDPSVDILTAYYFEDPGAHCMVSQDRGITWDDGIDPDLSALPAPKSVKGAATDENGRRYVSSKAADNEVAYSPNHSTPFALSTFPVSPAWTPQRILAIDADPGSSYVVVAGQSGDVAVSADGGVNFTKVDGFSISGDLLALKHTKDSSNPLWMIKTTTHCYVCSSNPSSNANWTTHTNSYLNGIAIEGSYNNALYYDKSYQRFVLVLDGRSIAYSENNGESWTTLTSILPSGIADPKTIAGDGFGEVLITGRDSSGNVIVVSSADCGMTWTQRIPAYPMQVNSFYTAPCGFAGQRFVIIHGATSVDAQFTLAA